MPQPLSAPPIVQAINRALVTRILPAPQENASQNVSPSSASPPIDTETTAATSPQPPSNDLSVASSRRRAQNVLTKSQKYKISVWMIEREKEELEKIPSKAVKEFPSLFRAADNANIHRVMRYWKKRNIIVHSYKPNGKMNNNDLYMSRGTSSGIRRCRSKTESGRGRKRAPWVSQLHEDLFDEFHRLRSCGVKFNSSLLLLIARKLVAEATSGLYGPTRRDPKSDKLVAEHLNAKWVERFLLAKFVFSRVQTGNLMPSAEKQELIEREVAFHLGVMMRGFRDKKFDEDCVFNADETHFSVNLDDGRTLAMKGYNAVKYSNVVSGYMGMTMMVMLGEG